jgi:hypothetical protein
MLPFSLSNNPVAVVPAGVSEAGMPIGVQLVARSWDSIHSLGAAKHPAIPLRQVVHLDDRHRLSLGREGGATRVRSVASTSWDTRWERAIAETVPPSSRTITSSRI